MPRSFARLTAVVLNREAPDLTVRAVRALLDDGVPGERIVVVDNGSRDESVTTFERQLAGCVVVALPQNVGYAAAANAGARRLPGDAYLVMNNDAFVHRAGSVAALLAALDDPAVGMAVPRLLNEDLTLQRTVRALPTPAVAVVRALGLGRLVPNRWQPRWSHHWDHCEARAIDAADGAVLLLRRETWDELGGYNEARSMYAEDSDLCWRTRKLGWKIWFTPDAEFVHLGSATASRRWTITQRATMIGREEAKLVVEQLSPVSAVVVVAATCAYLTWRGALLRLRGDEAGAAVLRAERAAYIAGLRAARGTT